MRLFVAAPVPERVRQRLAAALEGPRAVGDGLRWTRPSTWHVTLAFLGEVADERVDEAVAVVSAAVTDLRPCRASLGTVGRFRRKVLWVGVEDAPAGALAATGARVQRALVAARLPVEERPVRPHVTLARAGRRPVDAALVASLDVPVAEWDGDAVEIWRSHLGAGPARYEALHSVPLSAS